MELSFRGDKMDLLVFIITGLTIRKVLLALAKDIQALTACALATRNNRVDVGYM